ncbi:transcription factor S-II, central domain-containing protein, partial [Linnemannia elongata]
MNKENIPPAVYIPAPKRASTSTASSSSQPESPRVEQDPVRVTALKGLTECLLIGLELKSAGGEPLTESSEQAANRPGTYLGKGAGATGATFDEEQANRLAVAIEKELYGSTASPGFAACGRDYKAKYRSLFFNLKDKNNVSLRARLVSGELEPYDLVRLSHEELANPELQIINKEMRKRSIHNSVLTVEEEPYIKKTHKGELSFVPRLSSQRGKDAHDSNIHSPTGSPAGDVLDKLLARIQTNKRSSEGTTGDTFASDKRQRRTGTTDYRIEDAERSPAMHSTTPPDSPPPLLLEDKQKTAHMDRAERGAHRKQPTVWEGCLSMHLVAKFSAKAVQIGGRELFGGQDGGESRRQSWSDVLTKDISVDGRIGITAVETYVSKQAQSATKEIVVLKFETQESSSSSSSVRQRVEFDKLFEYFYAKQRNGVVPQRNRHVKDMYLVPMAAKDPLPGYLRELVYDDASVRKTVPSNCLLGVLVLNKEPS